MIKTVKNKKEIIPLWCEAFGDSEEEIRFFLENASYECAGYYADGELAAMLFLIKCTLCKEESNYIYAASTYKKFRKKGYMSELLKYCKNKYGSLCLIPADEKLVNYYKKRDFVNETKPDLLIFDEADEIKEWLFEGCELEHPVVLSYKR